ncbi:MAG TPA: DJ-1/PfpI family protein, partial [Candidatus Synoicihabitans sp.]|nr:DJ-1/PfpI family protein [Candidatus Synoicihabitans sp.]
MTTVSVPYPGPEPRHVSLVALPDAVVSTLSGIYDVMNAFTVMGVAHSAAARHPPFRVEIVGETAGPLGLASGVPIDVQRPVDEIASSDIVIVPSVLLGANRWAKDRYPVLVDWLRRMHDRGAVLCSACSGIFLLAETGLFDRRDATVHFGYAASFAETHPSVRIHPEQ